MRSKKEIIEKIKQSQGKDIFGFEWLEYCPYIDFESAKTIFNIIEGEWIGIEEEYTKDNILKKMHEYMPFAWEKANNCRGISANRSIMHYIAWIWLLGDDNLLNKVEKEYETNYHYYGKPILERICKHYNWDYREWDNGIRANE